METSRGGVVGRTRRSARDHTGRALGARSHISITIRFVTRTYTVKIENDFIMAVFDFAIG